MKMATLSLWTLSLACSVSTGIAYGQANVGRPQRGPTTAPGRPIAGAVVPAHTVPVDTVPAAADAGLPLAPVPEVLADPTALQSAELPTPNRLRQDELPIERLIVTQLQSGALATAELSELAAEQAVSEDIKAFAETVASDQQFFWRALERLRTSETTPAQSPEQSLNDSQPGVLTIGADQQPTRASPNDFGRPSLTESEQDKPTQLGRTPPVERQVGQTPLGQTLPDQFPLSQRPPARALPDPADFEATDGSDLNAALDGPGRELGGTLPPAGGETRPTQAPAELDRSLGYPDDAAAGRLADQENRRAFEPANDLTASIESPGGLGGLRPLASMAERVTREHLELSIQSLQRHENENFDRAFVVLQVAERTRALAELRAMDEMGSNTFREVIARAQEMTVGHLRQAVGLASRFEVATTAGDASPAVP